VTKNINGWPKILRYLWKVEVKFSLAIDIRKTTCEEAGYKQL